MIRRLVIVMFVFLLLFIVGYYTHNYSLSNMQVQLPFPLKDVYVFHFLFSSLLCFNFVLLSKIKPIVPQIGFIYLFAVTLKLLLFAYVFKYMLFEGEPLSVAAKISLLLPMVFFLVPEAIFVNKIISKNFKID